MVTRVERSSSGLGPRPGNSLVVDGGQVGERAPRSDVDLQVT
jgi:hypothetical protein